MDEIIARKEYVEKGLKQMSAEVPQQFFDDKDYFGVSWVFLIREGIKSLKLQEKLMQERIKPEDIDWRIRAKEKILEVQRMVR